MEDLSQNGLISFTGFYAVFNLSLLLCGVLKIISWTRRLKIFLENKKLARFTHYLANTRVYTSYCKDDHLKEGGNLMSKNTSRPEIDSLSFEVENQELSGKSGASGA